MINTKELRIGNWVNYIMHDAGEKDCPAPLFFSVQDTHGKYYNPIPITTEILRDAGFEGITGKESIWVKDRLKLWGNMAYLIEEDSGGSHYIPNEIKYVHQLQNLYYALFGRELKIYVK